MRSGPFSAGWRSTGSRWCRSRASCRSSPPRPSCGRCCAAASGWRSWCWAATTASAAAHGNLSAAARWLGRRYAVRGVVERGAGRARTIGVPTINLASPDRRKLLPPDGVYAVWVGIGDRGSGIGDRVGGMMNQGPRPTFGEHARALEVHLFDFAGALYGETVIVEWVERLRDVQAFASREALQAQLERDALAARAS